MASIRRELERCIAQMEWDAAPTQQDSEEEKDRAFFAELGRTIFCLHVGREPFFRWRQAAESLVRQAQGRTTA